MRFLPGLLAVGLICQGTPEQATLPQAVMVLHQSLTAQEAAKDDEAKGSLQVQADVVLHGMGCEVQWNGKDDGPLDQEATRPAPHGQFQKGKPAPYAVPFEPRT